MPKPKKFGDETIVLKGALSSLRKELTKLQKNKIKIERAFGSASSTLRLTRAEEIELRTRLNEMENIETKLSEQRENLESRLEKIRQREEKIKKIEEELEEI